MLFVVDLKDLDYQTMCEYDRFEMCAANSNASTAILKKQLEDPSAKVIVWPEFRSTEARMSEVSVRIWIYADRRVVAGLARD